MRRVSRNSRPFCASSPTWPSGSETHTVWPWCTTRCGGPILMSRGTPIPLFCRISSGYARLYLVVASALPSLRQGEPYQEAGGEAGGGEGRISHGVAEPIGDRPRKARADGGADTDRQPDDAHGQVEAAVAP